MTRAQPPTIDARSAGRAPLLALVGCAAAASIVGGCAGDAARRKAVADSAATIYEAALAIEAGVAPAAPAAVIKANAAAIIRAQGYQYPPAAPAQEGR